MQKRRRPGERVKKRHDVSPSGYPLDADRRLRARAVLHGQSLGEACRSTTERFPHYLTNAESYVARTRCDLRPGGEPTEHEIELMLQLADVQAGRRHNPAWGEMLGREIQRVVGLTLQEQISRVRRARQRAAVQEYSQKYRESNAPLDLRSIEGVPY
jgi:hypothetical protein